MSAGLYYTGFAGCKHNLANLNNKLDKAGNLTTMRHINNGAVRL